MPTPLQIAAALSALMPLATPPGAWAQAQTGTGGGAASTVTAPNTSDVGRTKPPGAAAGAANADDRRARTPEQKKDDKIQQGICIGCGAK
ncbi:hypothetical protein [uncultured Methylobacterium sp.]|uniref:hypothetical protein n=1 Tax=uncultured Methylobacterium sp. TaxID=157278 RepID=UPI0035C97B9B